MNDTPKTRYAKSSGINIAYQVIGQAPLDLVYVPGWLSNVEMMWENPMLARFLRRLASFSRLIVFDKRGTGLSDRVAELPTLEQRMDDVRAVMDAVGSARAALFGHSEGACMCMLFAATYPERTVEGRYIASRIAGAKYVEFPSGDHFFWASHQDEILAEIQGLLTGVRPPPEHDRILATVLFTDIVEGTKKAAALGDRRWRDLLESHHALVRAELARYRGTEQDTAGDGFYVTFDGPARAVRCAFAVRDGVRRLGLEIRAGVHTGECEAVAGKLGGIAAIIGARVRDLAGAGEVLATSTVRDLVSGSGLTFAERGAQMLKGVPGEWRLFSVTG